MFSSCRSELDDHVDWVFKARKRFKTLTNNSESCAASKWESFTIEPHVGQSHMRRVDWSSFCA